MASKPVAEAELRDALNWRNFGSTIGEAAAALGVNRNTFRSRMRIARENGLHLSPGARDSATKAGLGGLEVQGGHRRIYDDDGRQIDTVRYSVPRDELTEDRLDRIRAAFDGIPAALPVAKPEHCNSDLLTLYPIADAHIGMMAWGEEAGEDYDTKIATTRLVDWMGRAIAGSPNSQTAIILDVGDMLHADDQSNMTPRSKHILDADTRHFKTIDMTIQAVAVSIDLARAKHERVIVRILPGNHNPHSYMAVLFALAERYRNDSRVSVQKVPGEYFAHQFGKCFVASHHGDKAKAERMVMYMADRFPMIWGKTLHRYLWTGHLHHHKSADIGGVKHEQLRALTAKDAYAASHAYSARAQLQAVTYHREYGEVSRVMVGLS